MADDEGPDYTLVWDYDAGNDLNLRMSRMQTLIGETAKILDESDPEYVNLAGYYDYVFANQQQPEPIEVLGAKSQKIEFSVRLLAENDPQSNLTLPDWQFSFGQNVTGYSRILNYTNGFRIEWNIGGTTGVFQLPCHDGDSNLPPFAIDDADEILTLARGDDVIQTGAKDWPMVYFPRSFTWEGQTAEFVNAEVQTNLCTWLIAARQGNGEDPANSENPRQMGLMQRINWSANYNIASQEGQITILNPTESIQVNNEAMLLPANIYSANTPLATLMNYEQIPDMRKRVEGALIDMGRLTQNDTVLKTWAVDDEGTPCKCNNVQFCPDTEFIAADPYAPAPYPIPAPEENWLTDFSYFP